MKPSRNLSSFGGLPTAWHNPFAFGCIALAAVFILVSGLALFAMSLIGPIGAVLLFCALLSLWLWLAPKRRRRRKWEEMGNCPTCGYDQRESYERCPECGEPISENLARQRRIRAYLIAKKATTEAARRNGSKHTDDGPA